MTTHDEYKDDEFAEDDDDDAELVRDESKHKQSQERIENKKIEVPSYL